MQPSAPVTRKRSLSTDILSLFHLQDLRRGARNALIAFPSSGSGQAAAPRRAREPRYFIIVLRFCARRAQKRRTLNQKVPCCRRLKSDCPGGHVNLVISEYWMALPRQDAPRMRYRPAARDRRRRADDLRSAL